MSSVSRLLLPCSELYYSFLHQSRDKCSCHVLGARNTVYMTKTSNWQFVRGSARSNSNYTGPQNSSKQQKSAVGDTIQESNHARHLQLVLFQPQIAVNTACIASTCAAASVGLHLIEPLGFQIDDAKIKQAGLDYWPHVFVKVHLSWSDFMDYFKQQAGQKRLVAFTKRGTCLHTDKKYQPGDWLVFGSELTGLSSEALADCADESKYGGGKVRIPMLDSYVRCLNLSVSVGIGVYEALRQLNVLRSLVDETSEFPTEGCFKDNSHQIEQKTESI